MKLTHLAVVHTCCVCASADGWIMLAAYQTQRMSADKHCLTYLHLTTGREITSDKSSSVRLPRQPATAIHSPCGVTVNLHIQPYCVFHANTVVVSIGNKRVSFKHQVLVPDTLRSILFFGLSIDLAVFTMIVCSYNFQAHKLFSLNCLIDPSNSPKPKDIKVIQCIVMQTIKKQHILRYEKSEPEKV